MSSVKSDFIIPIVVLTAICIVASGALAATYDVTAPIIAEAERKAAEQARLEVLPEATGFTEVKLSGAPEGIEEVYVSDNGVGYAITGVGKGYGGEMKVAVGIDNSGCIVNLKVISHEETAGVGSKVADSKYLDTIKGKDSSLDGVTSIAGATVSSKCLMGVIENAFTAYEMASSDPAATKGASE